MTPTNNRRYTHLANRFTALFVALCMASPTWSATAEEQSEFAVDSEGKPCQVIPHAGFTITKPGRYCLTHDIFVQWKGEALTAPIAPAVLLRASNVTFDLNGHTIGYRQVNPLVSENGDAGINQSNDVLSNVVIRNGTIANFGQGIELRLYSQAILEGIQERWQKMHSEAFAHPQQNIVIENIVFRDNLIDAYLFGQGLVIRGSKFIHNGLSERQRDNWVPNPIGRPKSYAAVIIHGANSLIEDNQFELNGTLRGLPFAFIYLYDGNGATLSNNSFICSTEQSAPTYGVALRNTTSYTFRKNTFQGVEKDILQLPSF